jgi:hypothetical protein
MGMWVCLEDWWVQECLTLSALSARFLPVLVRDRPSVAIVDGENVTKLHSQNTVNSLSFKGRVTWHEHILSITSSTYTLRCFIQQRTNRGKWAGGPTIWRSPDLPMGPPGRAKLAWSMWSIPEPFPTHGSHLCFLSRVEDEVTWIHGPTTKYPTW